MRYLIRFEASLEAGSKIDRRPGGPGPAIGTILELAKPETFFVSVTRRELYMVVNTDDAALLGEIVHVIMMIGDCNPEVTPVMTGDDAMKILPGVIERSSKAAAALGG
ncbi:MAG TPA: DUF3303 family protein [Polyangiaceae bacterium]|nr:DUF3303 family protein [Polyangiaceae bacterium]